jgi:predicted helicase
VPDAHTLSPKHPAISAYYARREQIAAQHVTHETGLRDAFMTLLIEASDALHTGWTLVAEQKIEGLAHVARPDGTFRDANTLPRGYWEAKDTADDLDAEIAKKFARKYPDSNIIFEDTRRAVLYQNKARVGEYDLSQPSQVVQLLETFFGYTEPVIEEFERAVITFGERTPQLSGGLQTLIGDAHKSNKAFQTAYASFYAMCQAAINPNISRAAVDEMLVQHLLTERLMRTVFNHSDFSRKNAIAAEIEQVIDALTSKSFSRDQFIGQLDYFYRAIERAADQLIDFSDRQTFINTIYERFFQGYAVKVADTHGIVYTPQPIVEYMGAAVEAALRDEFGLTLGDERVCIIDPCTGTGNFIVHLLKRLHAQDPARLADAYQQRLFANEVMLMPYYIASLNIEHAYMDLTGGYAPFEGLCFVDTLDLAEGVQPPLFLTEKNTARVARQRAAPITVIVGNPPYNVGQLNENDNNKNRAYGVIDERVKSTYVKDSTSTLRRQVYDPYVKFFRWASDRLQGRDGIVCYITNNSFVDARAFDGMRKHLLQDFTRVYHLDLHGDVRKNPKLSGTTHNVFGIQVGVGVTVAIRSAKHDQRRLFYHRVPETWRKEEKYVYLANRVKEGVLSASNWETPIPDARHNWIIADHADQFESFMPLGTKTAKRGKDASPETVFKLYSNGVKTSRDAVVFDYSMEELAQRIDQFSDDYNAEVNRYRLKGKGQPIDDFVKYERVKWSRNLKRSLKQGKEFVFDPEHIRSSIYRPFSKKYLYFADLAVDELGKSPQIFPTKETENQNRMICVSGLSASKPFQCLMTNVIPCLDAIEKSQCFPFYTYDPDGTNRRENITDWALDQYQTHYADPTITKWDIFYAAYALLHQPDYRARYAAALKRDLPRLPYPADFWAAARAGRTLGDLHVGYETHDPYPLEDVWARGKPVSYRVAKKMRLNRAKDDALSVTVNDALTLRGIPAAALDYTLGGRSALEWIIDQYQIKTDKRSGITSDPNGYSEDERYIAALIGQVVAVSLATMDVIGGR